MFQFKTILAATLLLGLSSVSASPLAAPEPTAAPDLNKRATCTFSGSNGAASASASKKSCATIVLSSIAVPSGVTLDLTDLTSGTHVRIRYIDISGKRLIQLGDLRRYNNLWIQRVGRSTCVGVWNRHHGDRCFWICVER